MTSTRPLQAVTLEHVAAAAGVSRATVSRVINGVRNVDPLLQATVQRAVEETGYVPNRAARSLVTRRTGSLALVVSADENQGFDDAFVGRMFTDPFFGRLVSGVVSVLRPRSVQLVLTLAVGARERDEVVANVRNGQVDGVVLVSMHDDDPLPMQLTDLGLPVVLSTRPGRPVPISYVDVDEQAGVTLAAEHLIARGCTRVATVAGPQYIPAGEDRLSCFREVMAKHGFPDVPAAEGVFTQESGEQAMEQLLDEHPDLDGVFVANDLMALGAVHVLRERGRRIPQDVAVVGFDDAAVAVTCRPALTTVRQPIEDMAAKMTEMLLAQVDEPSVRPSAAIFQPTLVIRNSA